MIITKYHEENSINVFDKFFVRTEHEKNFNYFLDDRFICVEGRFLDDEWTKIVELLKSDIDTKNKILKIKEFNAKFIGVLYENNKMYVFTDKFQFYKNTFYCFRNNNFAITNNFNEIKKRFDFKLDDIDYTALNEFMAFEHTSGRRTFLKNVKYLLVAQILEYNFNDGSHKVEMYKNPHLETEIFKGKMKDYFDPVEKLLNNAIKDIKKRYGDVRYGLGISGGYDSRVCAYYGKKNGLDLRPYVFGEGNSDAFHISRKIADTVGLSLAKLEPDMDFVTKYYKKLQEHNPMMNCQFLWYYSVHDKLPEFDILLNGFNGDTAFGIVTWENYESTQEDALNFLMKTHVNQFSLKFLKNFNAYDTLKDALETYPGLRADEKRLNWNFRNRQHKMTKENPGMHFMGEFEEVGIFTDNAFYEFMLNFPLEWRNDMIFYFEFLKNKMPELAKIRKEREAFSIVERNPFKISVKKFVHLIDTQVKSNIFYKRQHKDIYKWIKNNKEFWEFADRIIERNKNKIDIKQEVMDKLIKRFRNGNMFFRTGKQVMPFFLYLSVLIFLDQFEK